MSPPVAIRSREFVLCVGEQCVQLLGKALVNLRGASHIAEHILQGLPESVQHSDQPRQERWQWSLGGDQKSTQLPTLT